MVERWKGGKVERKKGRKMIWAGKISYDVEEVQ